MYIKYYLRKIPIIPDPNEISGRVEYRGTLNESEILDKMMKRGTSLSRQDILSVLDLYTEVLSDQLQQGFLVNTRLANFRPGIKGIFRGTDDSFDPARHSFRASISEGIVLKKKMRKAKGDKQIAPVPAPVLMEYYDHGSATVNSMLTSGNIGQIIGRELKFNPANPAEGIFLVKKENGAETRVETISVLTDSKLMFLIPSSLAAGKYTVNVRRIYSSQEGIRDGRLNKTIMVD